MSETAQQNENKTEFAIQKIYLKDVSFETPNSPAIFTEQWKPDVHIDLATNGATLEEGLHEVVLTITVTAKVEEKTAFLVEIHQAGIFVVKGFDEANHNAMLGSFCPNILFPYAREAVSDLVTKGGFPQLLLSPINFDALYAQHIQQQQQQAQSTH